ncbi:MAG: response regulator [Defluviitaleaceae bacterium]|nr:response regulator [Defluviitaleaceae bacterium]
METDKSILVVDDDAMNITALIHILGEDYTVYAETDGRGCIESAKELNPDLILLDITMPDISGFEVIKILKQDEKTQNIPVIFVTGKNTPEDEERGFTLGAVDYISKPFSKLVVAMRVRHQMQIISQAREIQRLTALLKT